MNVLSPPLEETLRDVDLQALSRIDLSRSISEAHPNIAKIELVTSQAFEQYYDQLYVAMFPDRSEREHSDLIKERLAKQEAGERQGFMPYRIIGIRDSDNEAIGAAHFTVLSMEDMPFAVPYLQYIYICRESRRQNMSEILHTIVLGMAAADGQKRNKTQPVPFTLFETEPPFHGIDLASRALASERIKIHGKSGALALMLVGKNGSVSSSHVQPGLDPSQPPLTLLWAIRPSPALSQAYDIRDLGPSLMKAYYRTFREEGFPENDVHLAEQILDQKCQESVFHSLSLSAIPGFDSE